MLLDYELTTTLAGDDTFELRRGRRTRTGAAVLVKLPRSGAARPADAAALRRECALAAALSSASTLLPRVVESRERSALVMEDPGGELLPLVARAGRPPFDEIALLGAGVADALAELHARGVVHRGLRPEVVMFDAGRGRAWLVDLGEARVLSGAGRDASALAASRLVYASPEQSGRMERGGDQRSDLYSLGVLLYECLCGVPPFAADDPLELIHRHIAVAPLEPQRRDPTIPEPLSALVMKLLAKSPDERYQTARGVAEDLRHCAQAWARDARIEPFALGRRDASGQLAVSRKLYGREVEVQLLLAAFERACAGGSAGELVLVEGYAGIGKTALIQQLYRPIVRRRGYFISGKFDQVARGKPFGALIEAFRALVQQMLTEPEARLARWRHDLVGALGGNGGVLAEVMPEIEFVVGPQPKPAQLGSTEAQNRFQRVLQNFVDALARPEHPLVLFLDDLQWADASTLALLQPLLTDGGRRCLLVLCACRDRDSETTPLLGRALAEMEAAGVLTQRLPLGPLQPHDLNALIADTLHCDAAQAEPLARLVSGKTGGNPFFVTQFLKSLERDGHLRFDERTSQWAYRIAEIAGAPLADNVVELMTRSIQRLPAKSQYALTLAACIGNRFDRRTLAIVSEQSAAQTDDDLAQALAEGLIVAVAPAAAAGETSGGLRPDHEADGAFMFLHDRVQQAAYALIPPERRRMVHLTVGRLLRARTPPDQLDARRFEIVQHLDLGRSLIVDRSERLAVAALNLDAGRKAKASTAHAGAAELFAAGVELLDDAAWGDEHELAFALHLDAAESRYLCGQFDAASAAFERLLARTLTPIERARVIRLRSVQFENMARYADAIAATREGVAMFGVVFPDDEAGKLRALDAQIEAIDRLRGERPIAALELLPRMADPQIRIVASMLTDIWSAAYIVGDPTLARLISATLVRLSLEHGNVEESAYGYVTHAITVGAIRGDCAQAYDYGCLALAVNARFDDTSRRAKIYQQFHAHVNFWCRPFDSCAAYAREACRSGLESGDFLYAAYGAGTEPWAAMPATQDLARFERDHEPSIALIERLKNRGFADSVRVLVNWSRALQGRTDSPLSLSDDSLDEAAYLEAHRDSPFFTTIHAIAKLHLASLLGTRADALAAARHAGANVHHVPGTVWPVIFAFWNAMALAASDGADDPRAELREAQHYFETLAVHCEQNFGAQALLLAAELARIEGRVDEAVARYEQAVEFADTRPLLPFVALAHERCGALLVGVGRRALGRMHLAQARAAYAHWGAHAKVDAMRRQYAEQPVEPALGGEGRRAASAADGERLQAIPQPEGVDAGADADGSLDLFSVVKAAQAIAAETEVQGLLERLMRIAIENAGAQCGALVLESEAGPIVHAVDAQGSALATQAVPLDSATTVPIGLVNYVRRTAASVVLAQAEADERHGADPYFEANRPRSVICVAAQHQGRLVAVLYLENRRVEGAFTAGRVQVLQSLATQAAIALENARLRRELEAENSYLRRDLIANVSHDLRTPLVSIRGYLEMLASKGEAIDPQLRRSYLDTAVRQSEHLGTLIDELFELAKLDFKGVTLQCEPFQLADLASDVLQKFQLIADGKHVRLELDASCHLPAVDADLSLVERVFDNLIGNALKHTPPGGCVRLQLDEQPGGVQASVLDDGAGIAAADLPHIFDRFYRAGAAAGTGLGLAITRRILELHGCAIEAHSSAQGSRFAFTLPFAAGSSVS